MDGVVVIDKPKGPTSHDIVSIVKRLFEARKAGHTGTLDPLATGVLAICLNKATKISDQLMAGEKEYEVEILFGVETNTYDAEGEIVEERAVPDDLSAQVEKYVPKFRGEIDQVPPHFSAIKYKGKPLYKWAREGKLIDVPPRKVEIKAFEIEMLDEMRAKARILCSKGTYIRSICHDLGKLVGCGAIMQSLRRLTTGPFNIKEAVKIEELEEIDLLERQKYVVSIDKLVKK